VSSFSLDTASISYNLIRHNLFIGGLLTSRAVKEMITTSSLSIVRCCQRNLLYTGVTRGKRLVVLVGQKKAVAIAVRNVSGRRRWSKLKEWLGAAVIAPSGKFL